ncbi:MAG: ATP-binding cassette domain-containing protein [Deltaproteobacteria bacterium]|nr:ATP-binding cassette domain-containing protein [Deltaproteobacteria bacterium]
MTTGLPLALEARLVVSVNSTGPATRFVVSSEIAHKRGVLVFFGPSGAGKSLTLQALAGLREPSSGFLRVGDETLFDSERGVNVPAHKRRVGYVPQHDSLFPFHDVAENVSFGLPRRHRRKNNPVVAGLLEELGIAHLAGARPSSLSGGERQRVALARALAVKPRLLLLDEPLAAIDQEGRSALRRVLSETLERHAMPAVLVTHDPEEAVALGDTLVRFERGRTVEAGPPAQVLGRDAMVRISGTRAGEIRIDGDHAEVRLSDALVRAPASLLPSGDQEVRLDLVARVRGQSS